MRQIIISGNWKMNKSIAESLAFVQTLKVQLGSISGLGTQLAVRIFPGYLSLGPLANEASQSAIQIGAQNAHWEKSGAFTGEISAVQLKEVGIQYALVGHSERRRFFGETDDTVRKRASFLTDSGFKVMVCIGETLAERESGKMNEVLSRQIQAVFSDSPGLAEACKMGLSIAYEPVWAIGTGKTATSDQAQEAHLLIRDLIRKTCSPQAAEKVPILYGGSVKVDNLEKLLKCPDIDGALVGGASLEVSSFAKLVEIASANL